MKDFEVTDLLGNKRLVVSSNARLSSDDLRDVVSPLPISSLDVQTSADAGPIGALQLLALQSYGHVNTVLTCEMAYLTIPDNRPM